MDETVYAEVCKLMQSRTKTFSDVSSWGYFFVDTPSYDEKVCAKQFKDSVVCAALDELAKTFATLPQFTAAAIEEALNAQTDKSGLGHGKLNQPLRAAITGVGIGAGIYETAEILGRSKTLERMEFARRYYPAN